MRCDFNANSYLILVEVQARFVDDLQLYALISQVIVMVEHQDSVLSLVHIHRVCQLLLAVFGRRVATGEAA